jgi:hypothetical protein
MAELPEGQVSHAYLKSRTNLSNHPTGLGWGISVLIGDMIDDHMYKKYSDDPWKLTKDLTNEARELMPRIYAKEGSAPQAIASPSSAHGLSKMWTDMLALGRGGWQKGHPAAIDTAIAVTRQPDVLLTYHFPEQDRLYNNLPEDAVSFLNMVGSLGRVATGQVEALIMPGAHRDHTQYPALRWSAETYAFNRSE